MKIYDVLVVGNDVSAYYASALLGQKGYQVAHVLPDQPELKKTPLKTKTSELEPMFFGRRGISQEYLNQTKLHTFLQSEKQHYKEILSDGRILSRHFQKKTLRRYLLRHFPQEHLAIHRWFETMHKEYLTWAEASRLFLGMDEIHYLEGLEKYQWQTLEQVLEDYFQSDDLKESMQVMMNFHGYALHQIPAIEFILQWFWLIEEDAVPFNFDITAIIKHFKKESPHVEYLKSSLLSWQFDVDRYQITLKSKQTFLSRFIIGQTSLHDADAVSYRHIDVACNPGFFKQNFTEEFHFRKTPLFDSLRLIPLSKYHPLSESFLRIETISDAHKDIILTFVDRYFKGFEKNIIQATEYPPIRRKLRDVEDKLSEVFNPEVRWALWSEPKWLRIDLNYQPKIVLSQKLLKTDYYLKQLVKALEEETFPPPTSPVYRAFERWTTRFENNQPMALSFQLGLRRLPLINDTEGASIDQVFSDQTLKIPTEKFVALAENGFDEARIGELPIEKASQEVLKKSLLRKKPPLRIPIGFIQLNFMILFFATLSIFSVNALLTFAAAATVAIFVILRWLIFKEWTIFESIWSMGLLLVSFIQLNQAFNIGVLFIVFAVLGWILQSMPYGIFHHFFSHDPLREKYSLKYLKHFSQRMTRYTSSGLSVLGIGALATSWLIVFGAAMMAIGLSIWGYSRPIKPEIRKA